MYYPDSESSTIEFKRDFPQNDQIIKTVIGFCNQNGGKLIIGVNDQGQVTGVDDGQIEKALSSLDKAIFESTVPPIIPSVYVRRLGERAVLVIEVSRGMSKPYYRRKEGLEKGTYIRLGRNTLRAKREIIEELRWQASNLDFEAFPIHTASTEDLNKEKISVFLEKRKNRSVASPSEELLRSYKIIQSEHGRVYPSHLGLLLFGKNPQQFLSEAMIIATHFAGNSGREALATVDCEGTLFEQFEHCFAFLQSRLHRSYTIQGLIRDEELEIPLVALRESLLNALIHRNYHIKAPVKVAIFDNRVEIFSPGHFPGPFDSRNLLSGITYLRNPAICKVMREAGYAEKLGSGLIAIFDSYREKMLPTPVIVEGENFVKYTLPREGEFQSMRLKESAEDPLLSLFVYSDEVSIGEIMDFLKVSRATASRRASELVKIRKLQRVGRTRSVRYRIASPTAEEGWGLL
ncbi:MAG: hypothetical protein KR126chlam1_01136 [Chlamydiae bacterium]|nr:hypothetical protein [Chlamydiota bacterium]